MLGCEELAWFSDEGLYLKLVMKRIDKGLEKVVGARSSMS